MVNFAPNKKPHIVVVGAGILGCSVAFHAALRGAQITLVDAAAPGQGATRLSFAWLNAYGKEPFNYHDLNRRSIEMWARFARRLGIEITWGGEMRWAVTPAGADELTSRARQLQTWGYPTRILDAAEVARLEPNLNIDGLLAASYSDLDGQVNTADVVTSAIDALTAQGAEICTQSPVTGFDLAADTGRQTIRAAQMGDTRIPCDAVVLTGGVHTAQLAALAGVTLPQYHTVGITVVTKPLPPLFENIAVLHSPRDKQPHVNFRQFADGSVMVQGSGRDNYSSGDRGATDAEVAQILADAAGYMPALANAQVAEVRRGQRPIPQDGHPVIGFADEVSNLYLATTHSGVTLAPIIGELAAIEMVDGTKVELLEPFRLGRFG
ncbi:MAG: FAD-dependent oxidoreductase [Caldilineaceae bacterium]